MRLLRNIKRWLGRPTAPKPAHELDPDIRFWQIGDSINHRVPQGMGGHEYYVFRGFPDAYHVALQRAYPSPTQGYKPYDTRDSRYGVVQMSFRDVHHQLENRSLNYRRKIELSEHLLATGASSEYQQLINEFQRAYMSLQGGETLTRTKAEDNH